MSVAEGLVSAIELFPWTRNNIPHCLYLPMCINGFWQHIAVNNPVMDQLISSRDEYKMSKFDYSHCDSVCFLFFPIQALELLGKWNPMDVEDALELLSSQFTNRAVRHYAVSRLKEANDDVSTAK